MTEEELKKRTLYQVQKLANKLLTEENKKQCLKDFELNFLNPIVNKIDLRAKLLWLSEWLDELAKSIQIVNYSEFNKLSGKINFQLIRLLNNHSDCEANLEIYFDREKEYYIKLNFHNCSCFDWMVDVNFFTEIIDDLFNKTTVYSKTLEGNYW